MRTTQGHTKLKPTTLSLSNTEVPTLFHQDPEPAGELFSDRYAEVSLLSLFAIRL
jgi:hypothetical protein